MYCPPSINSLPAWSRARGVPGQAWSERPVIWLSGVRRVGKTTLARMVPDVVYLNCDVPSTRGALDDPEPRSESSGTR